MNENETQEPKDWTQSTGAGCGFGVLVLMLYAIGCLFCVCMGGSEAPAVLSFDFLLGWVIFLVGTVEQATLNQNAVLTAAACMVLLAVGLHFFLRWIHAQSRFAVAAEGASPRRWKVGWTAAVLALIVLMFVAGTAGVGFSRQVVWLATSPLNWHSMFHLQRIRSATFDYRDRRKTLPPGATFDAHGRMLYGWMSQLLPYCDRDLYKPIHAQIDFAVPWDHANNRQAFSTLIDVYQCQDYAPLPSRDERGLALSHYASNVRVIGGDRTLTEESITDGTSTTLLLGEAAGNYRPWGYPANWRDPALGLNKSPAGFGNAAGKGANFAFVGGDVRFLKNNISPEVLKALSTPNGGENLKNWTGD